MTYEYKILKFSPDDVLHGMIESQLNAMGEKGWRVFYANFDGKENFPWKVMMERERPEEHPPLIPQPEFREKT